MAKDLQDLPLLIRCDYLRVDATEVNSILIAVLTAVADEIVLLMTVLA